VPVTYMLFDVLYLEGHSLMAPEEAARSQSMGSRAAWRAALPPRRCRATRATRAGLEGGGEAARQPYSPGRSGAWIKVKNKQRRSWSWVAAGRTARTGWGPARGLPRPRGSRYAGRVGTRGREKSQARAGAKAATASLPPRRGPPRAPVSAAARGQVEFTEWTNEGSCATPPTKGWWIVPTAHAGPAENILDSAGSTRSCPGRYRARQVEVEGGCGSPTSAR
jgi:hypothetical protein